MVDTWFALCIALGPVVDGLILLAADKILKRENRVYRVWDLIRDGEGYPSLARFQFFIWTLIIIACFTTIVTLRMRTGLNLIPGQLPANLLILMGISTAVVPVSQEVSKDRYGQEAKSWRTLSEGALEKLKKDKPLRGMLLENGKPSFTRFQMFSWTLLSVFFYILGFAAVVNTFHVEYFAHLALGETELAIEVAKSLALPEIDQTLVFLMGLSQGGYVGGKIVAPRVPKILTVTPLPIKNNEKVTIRGVNFGHVQDQIWLGHKPMKIEQWSDEKIDVEKPNLSPEVIKNVRGKTGETGLKILVGTKIAEHKVTIANDL